MRRRIAEELLLTARSRTDYADVSDMFRRLRECDVGSPAFAHQRDAIVARTLPLADNIARRFNHRGEPLDDLIQIGRLGLVKAVDRFNVDAGSDFLGFAIPTIMGEIRRHFRDHAWAVKVPRRLKDLQSEFKRSRNELYQVLGRAPTASELSHHTGYDRQTVIDLEIACSNYSTLSTDAPAGSDPGEGHHTIGDTLGGPDPGLDKVVDVETVRPLIEALPARMRTVLTLRFFEDMTQSQIAQRTGYSQMHVSRLLGQALTRLRHQALAYDAETPGPVVVGAH